MVWVMVRMGMSEASFGHGEVRVLRLEPLPDGLDVGTGDEAEERPLSATLLIHRLPAQCLPQQGEGFSQRVRLGVIADPAARQRICTKLEQVHVNLALEHG